MTKRRSIHIGLNNVDPQQYGGWDGALAGCVNDANAMEEVAVSRGFDPKMLLNADATAEAVRAHLDAAAAELGDGDFLFLTYSGHGGQVPDDNNDEPDRLDEPGASTTPSWSTTLCTAPCAPSPLASAFSSCPTVVTAKP